MTSAAPPTIDNNDGYLWARWLFLRALGIIFFSAFYSLAFQIHGLIGERGILPADYYLHEVSRSLGALQDFSSYQSDGMLLEAGFISFFFAPSGYRPGLGERDPPSGFSLFMLRWEWFRIYFESGLVKILSGDPTWRNF